MPPLLVRRAQLQQYLEEHGIGVAAMRKLIASGRIERRYIPGKSGGRANVRQAVASVQVGRAVGQQNVLGRDEY